MLPEAKQKKKFKKTETGYHNAAVKILAEWVGGVIEVPFYVEGKMVFVPDVTVYKDGVIEHLYEVVHSHPITGKKYGLMQLYCYKNFTSLVVYEVDAHFILEQLEKPYRIETMNCYTINCMEYDEIQDDLLVPII